MRATLYVGERQREGDDPPPPRARAPLVRSPPPKASAPRTKMNEDLRWDGLDRQHKGFGEAQSRCSFREYVHADTQVGMRCVGGEVVPVCGGAWADE